MATLARINIHPVKSFDAQSVSEAVLLPNGALQHDRRYALRDADGQFVNGKRAPAVHRLRSTFDPATKLLTLRIADAALSRVFHIDDQRALLARWLSDYFEIPLEVVEDATGGFPDDTDFPGPTVISTATLAEVARWFEGVTIDSARGRFRANLEIDGVESFWEDRLVSEEGRAVRFRIGSAELLGTNPCQRCPVPSRDPLTGETIAAFARRFAERRAESLPSWAPRSRYDHFYRLAVNTRAVSAQPRTLRVGDEVTILGVE